MYTHEKEILKRITERLRERFGDRVVSVYAFGSRVRGDHGEWSDFDVLVIVRDRTPHMVNEIVGMFVDSEMETGIPFSAVIKDVRTFELEKKFNTPFYLNIMKEGVPV